MKKIILTLSFLFAFLFTNAQFTTYTAAKKVYSPSKLIVGKFNYDAYTDFAISNQNDSLTTFLGTATTTFTTSTAHLFTGLNNFRIDTIGGGIAKCALVATINQKSVTVNITKTIVTGTVVTYSASPSYNFSVPFRGVTDYAVGNLDGKGLYDFVFVGTEGIKVVRDSVTSGVYNYVAKLNAFGSFKSVKIADVNGDTKNDLILTTVGGNSFYVMLGNGHGSFGNVIEYKSKAVTGNATSIKFFPVNTTTVTPYTYVLSSTSASYGFTTYSVAPTSTAVPTSTVVTVDSTYGQGKGSYKLTTGDINGDGINDVITVDNDGFLRIYGGLSSTKPRFAIAQAISLKEPVDYIETGDFNGNGHTDIIYLGSVSRKITILLQ